VSAKRNGGSEDHRPAIGPELRAWLDAQPRGRRPIEPADAITVLRAIARAEASGREISLWWLLGLLEACAGFPLDDAGTNP
jgi:hypothetical protein